MLNERFSPLFPVALRPVLIDGCGRRLDHLRLSLTDGCNLRCRYCALAREERPRLLEATLAVALVRWLAVRHGVRHVRLTGGEPLLHPRLREIVAALSASGALEEITLTTNGQALARLAPSLRQAGLSRINVSLDTLKPDRFARLTRGGVLDRTLRGIDAALTAGLTPVRLNVVVQRHVNDEEIGRLAAWGVARGCTVRFLEVMPIGPMAEQGSGCLVPAAEILERLAAEFTLTPLPAPPGQPATDYAVRSRTDGSAGVIGVIASTTRPFCGQCRRLRITTRGEILSCLFDTGGSSLAVAWDGRRLDEDLADRILQAAVLAKPAMGRRLQPRPMNTLGG